MTWGQLRLQLQTSAAGVSLDLIDEYLNARYEQVLGATDWTGLNASATLEATAAHQSSTDKVSLTVGLNTVTGTGTAWNDSHLGLRFYRPGDTTTYTVASVASTTSLALDRAYEGVDGASPGKVYSAAAYVMYQSLYALPNDCGTLVDIMDPETGFPLTRMSQSELDRSAGTRALIGTPAVYALCEDSAETDPPVLHQIEMYPPPTYARGYTVLYRRAAYGFGGENTGGVPLPWVSSSVLLYGCRADIAAYLATQDKGGGGSYLAQARMYEAKFQEELARMLRIEHQQRRKPPVMRMADRFTRHRLARAARTRINSWGRGAGGPN